LPIVTIFQTISSIVHGTIYSRRLSGGCLSFILGICGLREGQSFLVLCDDLTTITSHEEVFNNKTFMGLSIRVDLWQLEPQRF